MSRDFLESLDTALFFPPCEIVMGKSLPVTITYEESALSSAGAGTVCGGRGAIRRTERGKALDGEWSKGVIRGIIECLRGPHRHWAAGQGEENGVEERKKRLSQRVREAERETAGDLGERSGKCLQGELLIVSQAC